MKKIFTLLMTSAITTMAFSQSVTTSGSTVSNITGPVNSKAWGFGATSSATTQLTSGQPRTDYLFVRGFDFSSLPANIVVTGLTVTFTRYTDPSDPNLQDSAVRVVLAGSVYFAANTNAAATPTAWTSTPTAQTYTFNTAALGALNTADFQDANFGIAISALRISANARPNVDNAVSVTLSYSILAPLILTDFTLSKNASNHVDIRFSTATEENVEHIYVERSTDGHLFEKIFTITPRGAKNVYTHYSLTDKAPVQGNNYYRITEVDKNGRWAYYITKMVNITKTGSAFAAYYNGAQVVAQISNTPGTYTLSIADLSGATIARQQVNMSGKSATVSLPSPSRAGIYIIVLSGQGVHETVRLAIRK